VTRLVISALSRPAGRPDPKTTKRPRGGCDLRRAPRDLCVCSPSSDSPFRRSASGARLVSAVLSSLGAASVDTVRDLEASPDRAPSGSRPDPACAAPTGVASRSGPTSTPIRSRCCRSPDGARPAFVSSCCGDVLPRARRHPRQDGNSLVPGPPPLSRVRLRRAHGSVWARGELLGSLDSTTAARTLGNPFAPPAVASSCELRSLSTPASNTRSDRRSRGCRDFHCSSTVFTRNPQFTPHLSQVHAHILHSPPNGAGGTPGTDGHDP
jgi:hypothetical protein